MTSCWSSSWFPVCWMTRCINIGSDKVWIVRGRIHSNIGLVVQYECPLLEDPPMDFFSSMWLACPLSREGLLQQISNLDSALLQDIQRSATVNSLSIIYQDEQTCKQRWVCQEAFNMEILFLFPKQVPQASLPLLLFLNQVYLLPRYHVVVTSVFCQLFFFPIHDLRSLCQYIICDWRCCILWFVQFLSHWTHSSFFSGSMLTNLLIILLNFMILFLCLDCTQHVIYLSEHQLVKRVFHFSVVKTQVVLHLIPLHCHKCCIHLLLPVCSSIKMPLSQRL